MTQEEKAKRYDEALEKARKYRDEEGFTEMEDLFPELTESEDERMVRRIESFLYAYGLDYFYYGWNKFDFFVVLVSIIDWVVNDIDGIDGSFLKTFQVIRVLKVLKVSRLLRIVKFLKGLEKIIQTFYWSFSALVNVLYLNTIYVCIYM